tara:strand:- start:500 stop:661 length:162 start_codon:yes stop_codon:yes gene_type:complete
MRIKEVISHILGETMGTVITAVQAVLTTKMGHFIDPEKIMYTHQQKQITCQNM